MPAQCGSIGQMGAIKGRVTAQDEPGSKGEHDQEWNRGIRNQAVVQKQGDQNENDCQFQGEQGDLFHEGRLSSKTIVIAPVEQTIGF